MNKKTKKQLDDFKVAALKELHKLYPDLYFMVAPTELMNEDKERRIKDIVFEKKE